MIREQWRAQRIRARLVDVGLVAVAEVCQLQGGRPVRIGTDQLVPGGVPHQDRHVAERREHVGVGFVADRGLSAGEQIGELRADIERPDSAHRIPGDVCVGRVQRVAAGDVRPHLEHVGLSEAFVELVGAARLGRDHE